MPRLALTPSPSPTYAKRARGALGILHDTGTVHLMPGKLADQWIPVMNRLRGSMVAGMISAAILCASCSPSEEEVRLTNGYCTQTGRYLSDQEYATIVLNWERKLWEQDYNSADEFLHENPKCCEVARFAGDADWRPVSQEQDSEKHIGAHLSRLGRSRYVVFVSINVKMRDGSTVLSDGYWLNACGAYLHRT